MILLVTVQKEEIPKYSYCTRVKIDVQEKNIGKKILGEVSRKNRFKIEISFSSKKNEYEYKIQSADPIPAPLTLITPPLLVWIAAALP